MARERTVHGSPSYAKAMKKKPLTPCTLGCPKARSKDYSFSLLLKSFKRFLE